CYSAVGRACTSVVTFIKLFFYIETAPPDVYTLSLHDALPISPYDRIGNLGIQGHLLPVTLPDDGRYDETDERQVTANDEINGMRSEEHTSELQSRFDLVCRLLLEKKHTKEYDH